MSKGRIYSLFVFFCILSILLAIFYLIALPDVSSLKKRNPRKTAFMEYREKERRSKGQQYKIIQIWVPLSKISPYLIKAVVIAEDDKFWKHEGFDYESIQKAIEKDIHRRKFKLGGSTLSQQLAKNLYLSPVKSLWRKTSEAILTWKIERTLSKRRILELYLNLAEWGEGIFGAEAAARHYFEKASSDLTPLEAARLAAVLPNPRKYDPTGNRSYVLNRSRLIYEIMIKRGIVEPEFEEVDKTSEENQPENELKPAPFPPILLEESNPPER
jgi:monofunctional biosynthetic peptidoglycan transglycosylase